MNGTSSAGALAVGFPVGAAWKAEIELWLPGYLDDSEGQPAHRDLLASFSMVRFFGAGHAQPYVVMGASIARTETRFTSCIADRVPFSPPGATGAVPTLVSCSEPDVRERRRERFTGTTSYLVGGAGVEVPLGSRLRIAPEIRIHASPASIIVRPAVAVIVLF